MAGTDNVQQEGDALVARIIELDRREFERRNRFRTLVITAITATLSGILAVAALWYPRLSVGTQDARTTLGLIAGALGLILTLLVIVFLEYGRTQRIPQLASTLGQQAEANKIRTEGWSHFAGMAAELRARLKDEVEALGLRGSINLAVGGLAALAGFGVLVWLAAATSLALGTAQVIPANYWGAFAAKLALALSVNVTAFFFFATYRRSLSDLKYFQNELTNVESKLVALLWADQNLSPDGTKELLGSWTTVERNFLLKRGESTADIASKELDARETQALAQILGKLASLSDAKA